MKIATAVYTLASVAVLALMVMRPPIEIANTAIAAPTAAPTATSTETTPVVSPSTTAAPPADVTPPAATTEAVPVTMPAPPSTPEVAPLATPTSAPAPEATPPATPTPAPDANAVPNYEREQRMASEIQDAIMDGEVISLSDGNKDFMGILTSAEQPRGAVIILHGRGYHPDWEDVVHPLRVGLAAKGWTTLSLQMPVLEKEAKYYDYVPLFANADKRINAGLALLKQQGITKIVLAAHSCGTHMAMNWVETTGGTDLAAYVGMGMGATDYQQEMLQPFPLDKLAAPVLDVYGEKDFPQVLSLAPVRQALMQKAGNTHSKQMVLPEADHDYKDKGDALTAVVANWLNSLP